MNGPSTGSSKKSSFIFIGLFWFAVVVAIYLALKYSGTLSTITNELDQNKITGLTSSFHSDISITIAEDGKSGYDGYAILRSKQNRKFQEASGIEINISGDGGDYYTRSRKLISGGYDIAVMPIHDYLEQISVIGADISTAPVIIAAISGSIGSDAVLSNPKSFKTINDLKGFKKIDSCFTSKFMLGSLAVDAGLPVLLKGQAYPNIDETFEAFMSGKCKVASLWEPYISIAKKKGYNVLMDSSELQLGKITDVILVNRMFLIKHQEHVQLFLDNYFKAVDYYENNINDLYNEIEINSGGERNKVEIAENLEGVKFFTLGDNSYTLLKAYPNSENRILDNIDAVIVKLLKIGSIDSNPLPNEDARKIVYPQVLQGVFNSYDPGDIQKPEKNQKIYSKISVETWRKLIRIPKFSRDDLAITFLRDGQLNPQAKAILDTFASEQIGNFDYYIAIVGKSGHVRGVNQQELTVRTQKKADRVYRYLQKYYQIDPNRITSIGVGSSMTPVKKKGQRYSAYINSNNTVEILFIDYN